VFDEIVDTPRSKGLRDFAGQVASMRAGKFDLAIVLPNSLAAGLVPFAARVPLRLGYLQGRSLLMNLGLRAQVQRRWYQRRIGPARVPEPMPIYNEKLLDVLGLPPGDRHPTHAVRDEDDAWVGEQLRALGIGDGERLLLLVVGANFGASKLWMPERFAEVGRHFERHHGMRALVLVGPSEVEIGERIGELGGITVLSKPVFPLDRLRALVRRGALMITGDTGPRHLAVAFDRPVVCLIGPTDPRYTNYCLDDTELIRRDLECMPCQRKVCPLGHHRCMRDIVVADVVSAGERLLARGSAPQPAASK
jgi:heptosyltransferase-2